MSLDDQFSGVAKPLTAWAGRLNLQAGKVLANPFLPKEAQIFISQLAALVLEMAKTIEESHGD